MKQVNMFFLVQLGAALSQLESLWIGRRLDTAAKLGGLAGVLAQSARPDRAAVIAKLFDPVRSLLALAASEIDLSISKKLAQEIAEALVDVMTSTNDGQTGVVLLKPEEEEKLLAAVKQVGKLRTVLEEELASTDLYAVAQRGIYKTRDLMSRADHHISLNLRKKLPAKAADDLRESGRCLAFETGTASAFHMWRALESVMDAYYKKLSGKSFADDGVTRNWGQYIGALKAKGAAGKIVQFLDHIRSEYRNPIAHPEISVPTDEAMALFGAGISSINQIAIEL